MKNKLLWFAAIVLAVMLVFSASFCWNADNKEWWQVLIPHLMFLVIFVLAFSLLYVGDTRYETKKMIYEKEAEIAAKEFERKREWDDRYRLTKEEFQAKVKHERVMDMLNILIKIQESEKDKDKATELKEQLASIKSEFMEEVKEYIEKLNCK